MDFLRSEARQRAILAAWRRRAAAEEAANLSRNLARYSGVAFENDPMFGGLRGATRQFTSQPLRMGLGHAGAGLVRAGLGGLDMGMGIRRMVGMPQGALDSALGVRPSLMYQHR